MSKKAEDFLKFAFGRGRGVGSGTGLPTGIGRGTGLPTGLGRGTGLLAGLGRGTGLPTGLPIIVGRAARLPVPEIEDSLVSEKQAEEDEASSATREVYSVKPSEVAITKFGSSGKTVQLSANYFKLIRKPNFEFCLYRVDFLPNIELAKLRKVFVGQQKELLGGYLFDGTSMIYTTRRLPEDFFETEVSSLEGETYKMTIKHTGMNIKPTDDMAVQILNLILRRTMEGLKMQLVGRNLYDPVSKVSLKEFKVELWPGYITSIRQHEIDVLVCCEVSHKVMHIETIFDLLVKARRTSSSNWQEKFKKEIIGTIVLTDYNNRTYRVDDVDFNSSPNSTFLKGEDEISYKEYYSKQHGINIKDPKQPMLISNPKPRDIRDGRDQKLFLVPELCRSTGLTQDMRKNFNMMKAMANHTQMKPPNRKERLLDLSRRIHNTQKSLETLDRFNTDIDDNLVSFKGRALPQETMIFGGGVSSKNDNQVDWTSAMRSKKMFKAVAMTRWAFLYPKSIALLSEEFLKMMKKVADGMSYTMEEAMKIELHDELATTYAEKIADLSKKDPKFFVIVVPNNAADRYAAIKRLTCVNRAIPTQVVTQKTLKAKPSGLMSITTKIVMQINCKLGGAPWMVKLPVKGLMSIGFDVNHDTINNKRSFGAFVASMDLQELPEYYSAVSPHTNGEELCSNMEIHINKAMTVYMNKHNVLPERIFFYRDGVGEGQIETVMKQEVNRIIAFLEQLYKQFESAHEPKLTFFVVNKRINTRIFLNLSDNTVDNPVSGTVVDNTITLPERFDFFLVSQAVRQGTVSPTSYYVIYDSNKVSADKLQSMTYKQTHLYYNWSGTVRVPAVVQYAHKLAFLTGEFLHQSPNEGFDNQLYFL